MVVNLSGHVGFLSDQSGGLENPLLDLSFDIPLDRMK